METGKDLPDLEKRDTGIALVEGVMHAIYMFNV